jgi:head-tail adaptor
VARPGPRDPGERDRYVTIQQVTRGKDTAGMPKETWTPLVNAWMSKQDVGGRERFADHQTSSPYDTRWEMGYRTDMDPELLKVPKLRRLVYQGREHDIVAASMIGRREGIELLTLARNG